VACSAAKLPHPRRHLRSELGAVRTSVRWIETTQPVQCADCPAMYVPGDADAAPEEPAAAAAAAEEEEASAAPASARGSEPQRAPQVDDPKTIFLPWPSHRAATQSSAYMPSTAVGEHPPAGKGCDRGVCRKHRRDEEWYGGWRSRNCRFLAAMPHGTFRDVPF